MYNLYHVERIVSIRLYEVISNVSYKKVEHCMLLPNHGILRE